MAPSSTPAQARRDLLLRALLVGIAAGAALAVLEVATVRVGYASRAERAAVIGGVSALLLLAGALVALVLAAVDGLASRLGRGRLAVRAAATTLATAAWWIPVALGVGRTRVLAGRLGGAASAIAVAATGIAVLAAARGAIAALGRMSDKIVARRAAALGTLAAIAAFLVDALVWRHRLPELHAGLLGVTLAALLFAAAALTRDEPVGGTRKLVALGLALALAGPVAATALRVSQNVWFIAHEQTTASRQVLAAVMRALAIVPTRASGEVARRVPKRRGAQGGEPAIPSSSEAHLVLITVDALRPDHTGAYGYARKIHGESLTPTLDALAERGVRFERAYAQAPHSAYSISSLLTSEYMHSTVQLDLPPPPTLAELLGARGLRTEAYFPLGVFFNGRKELAAFAERRFGFQRAITWDLDARALTDHVLNRLDELRREGEPRTFLWVHYFDVHEPYVRHPEYDLGASPMDRYDSEIAFFDRELARLIAALQQLDRPTVLAITADHGEEFKEHGGWYHGSSLYEEQVRVPLIVVAPGLAPRVVHGPVELVDVAPTLMELLGFGAAPSQRGDDLGPALVGAVEPSRPVYSEVDTRRMVTDGKWKLVHDVRRDTWELYDLAADPRELVNLYDRERARADALAVELRAWIDSITAEARHPEPGAILRARLGDHDAVPELAQLLLDGKQPDAVRVEAARLIGALEGYSGDAALRQAIVDPATPPSVRAEVALAMGELTDHRGIAPLVTLLDEPHYRRRAAVMLGRLRDARASDALVEALADPDLDLRKKAIHYLGFVGDARAIAPLEAASGELVTRPLVGLALARIAARLDPAAAAPVAAFLLELLARETYEDHRAYLVCALGLLGDPAALDAARRAALAEPPVKWATETLVRLGAIPRGAVWGVDFAPERLGLDGGFDHCQRRPPPPGGESTDDYAGRTTCELVAPVGELHFSVEEPRDALVSLRIAPTAAWQSATLRVVIDGRALATATLDPGWHELHFATTASTWQKGSNAVRLEVTAPSSAKPAGAIATVDHLLVIPRPRTAQSGK